MSVLIVPLPQANLKMVLPVLDTQYHVKPGR